jgi:Tesmin/TSO1-like CXC domain, cysteine-rich domain
MVAVHISSQLTLRLRRLHQPHNFKMYSANSKEVNATRLGQIRRLAIANHTTLGLTGTSEHVRRMALVQQLEPRAPQVNGYQTSLVNSPPATVRLLPTYPEPGTQNSQAVSVMSRSLAEPQDLSYVYRHDPQAQRVIIVKRSTGPEPWSTYQNSGMETWRRHYRVGPSKNLLQQLQYGTIRPAANPGFTAMRFGTDRIEHGTTTSYDAVTPTLSNRHTSRPQNRQVESWQVVPPLSTMNTKGRPDQINLNTTPQVYTRLEPQRIAFQSSAVASDVVNRRKRKLSDFLEEKECRHTQLAPQSILTLVPKVSDKKHDLQTHTIKQTNMDDDPSRSKSPASLQISHEPLIHHTNKTISGFGKLDLLCSATLEMGEMYDNPSGCSCPKSRCIALYCDCFKAGRRCNPDKCKCVDCKNTITESGANGARTRAIQSILGMYIYSF